jgi:hypothetical protein
MLMSWFTISLERGDERAQTWREDDQITSAGSGGVGVGDARRHEYSRSRTNTFGSVAIPKNQLAVENMPRFVVGMVDVESGGTATAPLVDRKRVANGGEGSWFHSTMLLPQVPRDSVTALIPAKSRFSRKTNSAPASVG